MGVFCRFRAGLIGASCLTLAVLSSVAACHGEPPVPPRGEVSSSAADPPLAANPSAGGQPTSTGAPASRTGEEHFTGRTMSVAEAKKKVADMVVGEVLDTGSSNPDSPGESYQDGAKLRVVSTLLGSLTPQKELTFSFTRRTIPAEEAEAAPIKGEKFIFFLVNRNDGTYRAIKILRASDANVKQLSL